MARTRKEVPRRIPINRYPFTPDTYPGRRPRFSFFFTPQGICPVRLGTLGKLLQSRDLPPLDERYAILAYGSNACPGQLRQKCEEYGLNDVPVLYGRLTGAETVYARRTTNRGYVPATLAKAKTSRSSWITLLTAEQLRAMDRSETAPTPTMCSLRFRASGSPSADQGLRRSTRM